MSTFNICTALPQTIIEELRNNGAEVRDARKIIVINVLDSQPIEIYDKFLQFDKEVDRLLTPHFGNPPRRNATFLITKTFICTNYITREILSFLFTRKYTRQR